MSENFYEAELRKVLRTDLESQRILEVGDSSYFFEQLAKSYPADGSKIDWERVPGSIQRVEKDRAIQAEQFTIFFDDLTQKFSLSGNVVYVGDSATDFALKGSVDSIRKVLPELLTIPQHHYLLSPDCSWCFCFTMEGDMGFGLRPQLQEGTKKITPLP